MRLFVEAPLPEELKAKLASVGEGIRQEGITLVKPGNMHATLKFIGEVPEQKLKDVERKLGGIRFKGFECSVRGVGVFPNENYIKVVWAGVESGGKLEELAKDVIATLHGYGEDERFSAHITIARVKKKTDLRGFIEMHRGDEFGGFTVSSFNLMESVLKPTGPEYRRIAEFAAD